MKLSEKITEKLCSDIIHPRTRLVEGIIELELQPLRDQLLVCKKLNPMSKSLNEALKILDGE